MEGRVTSQVTLQPGAFLSPPRAAGAERLFQSLSWSLRSYPLIQGRNVGKGETQEDAPAHGRSLSRTSGGTDFARASGLRGGGCT